MAAGVLTGALHFGLATRGWLPALGVAFFSTALPVFSFLAGMNATGPTKAAIISMLEPVVSIVASLSLLQEKMTLAHAVEERWFCPERFWLF